MLKKRMLYKKEVRMILAGVVLIGLVSFYGSLYLFMESRKNEAQAKKYWDESTDTYHRSWEAFTTANHLLGESEKARAKGSFKETNTFLN
jgi:hypothetical protein